MKRFYYIEKLDNGLCDITIYGDVKVYKCEHGNECDIDEYTLYSVPYYADIELNIREHFEAWKAHAMAFTAERKALLRAIGAVGNYKLKRKRRKHHGISRKVGTAGGIES